MGLANPSCTQTDPAGSPHWDSSWGQALFSPPAGSMGPCHASRANTSALTGAVSRRGSGKGAKEQGQGSTALIALAPTTSARRVARQTPRKISAKPGNRFWTARRCGLAPLPHPPRPGLGKAARLWHRKVLLVRYWPDQLLPTSWIMPRGGPYCATAHDRREVSLQQDGWRARGEVSRFEIDIRVGAAPAL